MTANVAVVAVLVAGTPYLRGVPVLVAAMQGAAVLPETQLPPGVAVGDFQI